MHKGIKAGDKMSVWVPGGRGSRGAIPKGNSIKALTLQGIDTIDRSLPYIEDRTLPKSCRTVLYLG
jgi:hypothetical protein